MVCESVCERRCPRVETLLLQELLRSHLKASVRMTRKAWDFRAVIHAIWSRRIEIHAVSSMRSFELAVPTRVVIDVIHAKQKRIKSWHRAVAHRFHSENCTCSSRRHLSKEHRRKASSAAAQKKNIIDHRSVMVGEVRSEGFRRESKFATIVESY